MPSVRSNAQRAQYLHSTAPHRQRSRISGLMYHQAMRKRMTQLHREFLEAVLESPGEALPRQIADAEFSLATVEELTRWGYIQCTSRGFKLTTTGRQIVRPRAGARLTRGFAHRFSRA